MHWTPTDEGPGSVRLHPDFAGMPITSNLPLRGGKGTIYEGGTREPCIVVWPGVTRPGTRSEAIVQSIDFYPTLLEMAGLKPQPGQKFDGISIVPALQGQATDRETAIYCIFPHYAEANGCRPFGLCPQRRLEADPRLLRQRRPNRSLRTLQPQGRPGRNHQPRRREAGAGARTQRHARRFSQDSKTVVPTANPAYGKPVLVDPLQGWKARNCDAVVANGTRRSPSPVKMATRFLVSASVNKPVPPWSSSAPQRHGGPGKFEWPGATRLATTRPPPNRFHLICPAATGRKSR